MFLFKSPCTSTQNLIQVLILDTGCALLWGNVRFVQRHGHLLSCLVPPPSCSVYATAASSAILAWSRAMTSRWPP